MLRFKLQLYKNFWWIYSEGKSEEFPKVCTNQFCFQVTSGKMSIFCRIFSLQIPLRMYRLQLHRNLVRKAKAKKKVGLVRIHADTYQVSFFVIRFVDYVMYVNMYVCKPTMYFFCQYVCILARVRRCVVVWVCLRPVSKSTVAKTGWIFSQPC